MSERFDSTAIGGEGAVLESEEWRALKTAEANAQALRNQAIAREQARLQAVAAALEITPEELLGLPLRKRRRRSNLESE